jgi:hypothetical protein
METSTETPSQQLAESLQTIRETVVDETAKMVTSTPEISPAIVSLANEMLTSVAQFEDQTKTYPKGSRDMLSPESLYRPMLGSASPSSEIVRLYELLNKYDKHLSAAIKIYDEEVPRETEMTLFQRIVYELDYLVVNNSNLSEVNTALKVALFSNNPKTYKLEQIISLRKVLELIKKDISVGERTLMEILSALDDHFSLASPLAEVDFIE